ncbi:MAG: hypothetical protein MHM6MM_005601, partial [Cercozoa sp. M6MM]
NQTVPSRGRSKRRGDTLVMPLSLREIKCITSDRDGRFYRPRHPKDVIFVCNMSRAALPARSSLRR